MTVFLEKADLLERCITDNKQHFEYSLDEKHIRKWETTLASNCDVKALLVKELLDMGFSEQAARRILRLPDTDIIRDE